MAEEKELRILRGADITEVYTSMGTQYVGVNSEEYATNDYFYMKGYLVIANSLLFELLKEGDWIVEKKRTRWHVVGRAKEK